ncbi:LLM class flavin-dependent oxidoreductase [Flavihumibacter petaseus]|uniref:Luciferase-like monooxygenase n=1 Tax=Flavihumibacter petaseus NBRC 106054 TaxID=1220578 RepID=A0A0E9N2E3_9BACT|nr:LLM class flavin-dependent oxidoreductase [Flavihumibacter petaseus]GAO43490.1 putative oxidoreductase [Flavihumibacter petaseus NBRC 106054]
MKPIKISVLDLAVITQGGTAATALERTVDLARFTETLGYERFWLAEHHNMANIASAATAVLIGHVAGATSTIRVGSGGIMLPNHSPLVIAEQFGTLETLYPGRIDLGLGRAPGTDQLTAAALRRHLGNGLYDFKAHIEELEGYFTNSSPDTRVRAFPAEGLSVPFWILGSSTDSAYLAAEMGLPYAFASHFAPAQFLTAIEIYRQRFQPSVHLAKPYVMACVNVVAAPTDEEAKFLASSVYQMFLGIIRNNRRGLQPPVEDIDEVWEPHEAAAVKQMTAYSFVGGPEKLAAQFDNFLKVTKLDEIMVTTNLYDQEARKRSYALLKDILVP